MRKVIILVLVMLASYSFAATCDPTQLYSCQQSFGDMNGKYVQLLLDYNNLNIKYLSLLNQYSDMNALLNTTIAERDSYKAAYENSPIDKLQVKDWKDLNSFVVNNYMYLDGRIYDINANLSAVQENVYFIEIIIQVIILLVALEIILFKFNLIKFVLRIKPVFHIKNYLNLKLRWIKNTKYVRKCINFVLIKEHEHDENKKHGG